MDIELFQWVLLGLLALGVAVLVALLATLGGIKRALEQRSPRAETPSPTADEGAGSGPSEETARDQRPEEAAAADPGGTPRQADTIRTVLEEHGLADTPIAASHQSTGTQSADEQAGVVDSAFAAHADDPQEEPFQRDGRWWFRRGDELLLYDEASGQWQPAPEGAGAPAAGSAQGAQPAAAGAEGSAGAAGGGVQTTPVSSTPDVADQVATFWKCPTCGAVNGSTSATCRMCFAARP